LYQRQAREFLGTGLFWTDDGRRYIDAKKVRDFQHAIDESSIYGASDSEATLSFGHAQTMATMANVPFTTLLRAVWQGNVRVMEIKSAKSLTGQIRLAKRDVFELLDETASHGADVLTKQEAYTRLGLREEELDDLREAGYFVGEYRQWGPNLWLFIPTEQVKSFEKRFISKRKAGFKSNKQMRNGLRGGWSLEDAIALRVGQKQHPILCRTAIKTADDVI